MHTNELRTAHIELSHGEGKDKNVSCSYPDKPVLKHSRANSQSGELNRQLHIFRDTRLPTKPKTLEILTSRCHFSKMRIRGRVYLTCIFILQYDSLDPRVTRTYLANECSTVND